MKQIINSIQRALADKNWYVALFASICLPDICGKIEYPELNRYSSPRYIKWYEKYMLEKYSADFSKSRHVIKRALKTYESGIIKSTNKEETIKRLRQEYEELKSNPITVWLNGKDCYALRCAVLHAGSDDLLDQEIQDVVKRINFNSSDYRIQIHCIVLDDRLQIMVDTFCYDMLEGVNAWLNDIQNDVIKMKKVNELLEI